MYDSGGAVTSATEEVEEREGNEKTRLTRAL